MNKFMTYLQCIDKNEIYPIIPKLRVENFNYEVNEISYSEYEQIFEARLIYSKNIKVRSDCIPVEKHIKDLLSKEISWQLYGDAIHLCRALYGAIMKDRKEESLEILSELMKEIES